MKKCMAANWKMFKTAKEAADTIQALQASISSKLPSDREVVVFPPFTAIPAVSETLGDNPDIKLGGQNFYPASEGAFTGEISPGMLLDLNCDYALVGHSERRHIIKESGEIISSKVDFGLQSGLKIVLCIGETLEERNQGKLQEVLQAQISALQDLSGNDISNRLEIAYEPVWAIGTGEVAGPREIKDAHGLVRTLLQDALPNEGGNIRILYGGSVKPENTSEIISIDNVDGVLVGGASLDADKFSQIVLADK
ncbi:MAG: triose-phosphate isomerase [Thermodesulfobacteriota bacterium]